MTNWADDILNRIESGTFSATATPPEDPQPMTPVPKTQEKPAKRMAILIEGHTRPITVEYDTWQTDDTCLYIRKRSGDSGSSDLVFGAPLKHIMYWKREEA